MRFWGGFTAVAFALVSLQSAAVSAQNLLAPSDPVAVIEGDWTGRWDGKTRVRVENGKVTLLEIGPKTTTLFKPGMVIARLNNGGKTRNDGRTYIFSSSQCLQWFESSSGVRYEMLPCGENGASLQTYVKTYEFGVSGISLRIPRDGSAGTAAAPRRPDPQPAAGRSAPASTADTAAEAERQRIAAREAREAEFQAKQAAHEAGVADYERKLAAQKAEIARQQDKLASDRAAAARVVAEHQRKMAEHEARQQEYLAAQRRRALCVGGDQQACADIAAGKPALQAQQLASAEAASTDTDANRCVTTAEVRTNASFQGNTAASVMNGCGQKVDVRICLKRAEDWNCGTDWGVSPQGRAVHSSFNATGEVFVDARLSSSSRPLASPGGN